MQGKASIERLVHFNCAACLKWWSVGDAPTHKTDWFCPWCGQPQQIVIEQSAWSPDESASTTET